MRNILMSLENLLFAHRPECNFDTSKQSHVLILPGMLGSVSRVFPLVNFLRRHQSKYAITAIPQGLSIAGFEALIDAAYVRIQERLLSKTSVKEIIIFGHSHGGRVACVLSKRLKSPQVRLSIVTAGSPLVLKPRGLSWFRRVFYSLFSQAFREWPLIGQPEGDSIQTYIGYYSDTDRVVDSESAKHGHQGELRQLDGFSHTDFINAQKMGPILLSFLKEIG